VRFRALLCSLLLLLLLLASGFAAPARADWTLVRDDEGIRVEREDVPGRVLPRLRAVVHIERPVADVVRVIRDVSTHTRWMHHCTGARSLGQQGRVLLLYNRISPHWAISDRDVVLRSELLPETGDGSARIEFHATDEIDYAPDDSVVRMPLLEGHYDMRPDPGGGTRVEYQVESDPGGAIPGWLVSRTAQNLPWFTLRNLRESVEAREPD